MLYFKGLSHETRRFGSSLHLWSALSESKARACTSMQAITVGGGVHRAHLQRRRCATRTKRNARVRLRLCRTRAQRATCQFLLTLVTSWLPALPFTECSRFSFGQNRRMLYAAAHTSLSGHSYARPPGNCCPFRPPGNHAQRHLF